MKNWKWWRRLMGGRWVLVAHRTLPSYTARWAREIGENEVVLEEENHE